MAQSLATLNVRGLRDPSKCGRLHGKLSNLVCMLLQCKRLTSLALQTVGCLRMTMPSFQNPAVVAALRSLR